MRRLVIKWAHLGLNQGPSRYDRDALIRLRIDFLLESLQVLYKKPRGPSRYDRDALISSGLASYWNPFKFYKKAASKLRRLVIKWAHLA